MKKINVIKAMVAIAILIAGTTGQLFAQEEANVLEELYEFMDKYQKECPDVNAAFYNLHDTIVMKKGKLGIKEKELIALGIAISVRCEYCIYFHTVAASKSGASKEEILEAASVAVYMGGGPAYSYIVHVFGALKEISEMKEKEDMKE